MNRYLIMKVLKKTGLYLLGVVVLLWTYWFNNRENTTSSHSQGTTIEGDSPENASGSL